MFQKCVRSHECIGIFETGFINSVINAGWIFNIHSLCATGTPSHLSLKAWHAYVFYLLRTTFLPSYHHNWESKGAFIDKEKTPKICRSVIFNNLRDKKVIWMTGEHMFPVHWAIVSRGRGTNGTMALKIVSPVSVSLIMLLFTSLCPNNLQRRCTTARATTEPLAFVIVHVGLCCKPHLANRPYVSNSGILF